MFSKAVRIRARSFSSVNSGKGRDDWEEEWERSGNRAFRDVVGAALVVLRPMPTTRL
jgi:hypothetical protein